MAILWVSWLMNFFFGKGACLLYLLTHHRGNRDSLSYVDLLIITFLNSTLHFT